MSSEPLFDSAPVREMTRAVHALALELREPVWRDVNGRWNAVLDAIKERDDDK
jgi:hypothetical protein